MADDYFTYAGMDTEPEPQVVPSTGRLTPSILDQIGTMRYVPEMKGIGGSTVGGTGFLSEGHRQEANNFHPETMSPDQLMALAQNYEDEYDKQLDGSTAVDSSLIRSMGRGGEVPQWLQEYMEATPASGTMMVDSMGHQNYKSERELLRKRKQL